MYYNLVSISSNPQFWSVSAFPSQQQPGEHKWFLWESPRGLALFVFTTRFHFVFFFIVYVVFISCDLWFMFSVFISFSLYKLSSSQIVVDFLSFFFFLVCLFSVSIFSCFLSSSISFPVVIVFLFSFCFFLFCLFVWVLINVVSFFLILCWTILELDYIVEL